MTFSVIEKLRQLRDVVGSGWSDGDVPVYNASEDRFEPGAGGGGSDITSISGGTL